MVLPRGLIGRFVEVWLFFSKTKFQRSLGSGGKRKNRGFFVGWMCLYLLRKGSNLANQAP